MIDDDEALALVRSVRGPTRLQRSRLSVPAGAIWLKREDEGPNGAFKWRGALCACAAYAKEGATSVVTASTGNHGAATAWAAKRLGLEAHVVVPAAAGETKCRLIVDAGATLHKYGEDMLGAAAHAEALARERIAPYFEDGASDAQLRGTGTIGRELAGHDLDAVVVPLAIGALAGGIARNLARLEPHVQVYGVQAEGFDRIAKAIETGADSGASQEAETFADGLADNRMKEPAFSACRDHLAGVVVVDDDEIRAALRELHETDGVLAEGAGAAALAGLSRLPQPLGRKVALIVSGRNIDRGLAQAILGRQRSAVSRAGAARRAQRG